MRAITALEASRMRSIQESAMNDLCNIINFTLSEDDYGDEVLTPTVISGVACGISFVGGFEERAEAEGYTQISYDATIRLPVTTTISGNSQITLVDQQDITINKTFKVTGFPKIGISAINVNVREITN